MNRPTRRGVYPGSFNPPTTAHLAVADAARRDHQLDVIILTLSLVALGKEDLEIPRFEDRLAVLRRVAADVPWLFVETTDHQLIADIAVGFDVVIMGADKWHQIHDPVFYNNDPAARDAALASLPTVAVAPRGPERPPPEHVLPVEGYEHVSSTAARSGDHALMLPAALEFDRRTGAWSNPDAYLAWLGGDAAAP